MKTNKKATPVTKRKVGRPPKVTTTKRVTTMELQSQLHGLNLKFAKLERSMGELVDVCKKGQPAVIKVEVVKPD